MTETVSFTVGGRHYKLACGAGEAARLQTLAQRLDGTAQKTLRRHGALREEMLLLLVGLTLADELDDAHRELQRLGAEAATVSRDAEARGAAALQRVAERLGRLVDSVDSAG
jgi:cell division protein ZapA